jgi:hypothetical protein
MMKVLLAIFSILFTFAPAAAQATKKQPLKLGPEKQLFVDNFIINSVRNLKRVLHRPERHPGNPIMTGTESWEHWLIGVNGRAVIYDGETKEFKMWYGAYSSDPTLPYGQGYRVCYAVSKDGVNWTRPAIGQVEWQGSRKNNLLSWGDNWMRRPNVIKDTHERDPNRRYKMTYVDMIDGKSAIVKAYSKDGINWKLNVDRKPWFTNEHSANLLGWDPRIQQYVLYRRVIDVQDMIGRSTSVDFSNWSEPQVVLAPGLAELDKGFQGLAAFLYEDLYLGFLWVRDVPRRLYDSDLAFSRDGIKWERFLAADRFLGRGAPGSWDSEGVTPVAPVVHGDEIWIYYCGWNYPYGGASLRPAQEGWVVDGVRRQSAIGLARLRLDGFVSLDAGKETGLLITKTLELSGSLIVNADVRGELRVEILDEQGQPVPGFSAKECDPIRSDSIRHVVSWNGKSNLIALTSKPVKLRFIMHDGSLFSFSAKKQ